MRAFVSWTYSSAGLDAERRAAERTAPVHRERLPEQRVARNSGLRYDRDDDRGRLADARVSRLGERHATRVLEVAEREVLCWRQDRGRQARERQRPDDVGLLLHREGALGDDVALPVAL